MMKTIKKALFITGAVLAIGVNVYPAEEPLITYQATVHSGDTLWTLASRIATDKDNISEVVARAMKENDIKNPANIQPGDIINIRVKQIKG